MGVVKTINNKQYQQDEKGDWYEVPMPEQNPSIKVIDGRTYQKDRSGNWYDMGESVKKKRSYWSCCKDWWASWRWRISFRSPIFFPNHKPGNKNKNSAASRTG